MAVEDEAPNAEEPNVDDDVEADLSSVRNVSAGSDPSARASKSVVSGGGAGRQSTGAAPQGSSSQPVPAPSHVASPRPPLPVLAAGAAAAAAVPRPQHPPPQHLRRAPHAGLLVRLARSHPAPCCCLRLRFWCCPVAADAASGSGSSAREITITSAMTPAEAMAHVMVVLGGAAAGPIFIYMLQKHMEEHVERCVKVALTVRSLVIAVVEYNVVLMLLKY
ncbi:unnamed protein product [Ectocarpus sp. 6 AP-2014]